MSPPTAITFIPGAMNLTEGLSIKIHGAIISTSHTERPQPRF